MKLHRRHAMAQARADFLEFLAGLHAMYNLTDTEYLLLLHEEIGRQLNDNLKQERETHEKIDGR